MNNISTYYSFNSNYELIYISSLNAATGFRILKAEFKNNSSSNQNINLQYKTSGVRFFPIFNSPVQSKYNVSTDFALKYGLNNNLLSNIEIIANGTNGSNSAAGSLNNSTSQMNSSQNSLVTQEDSFNDQMNNSLNNINPNFNINTQFGSKFITSANWVKTQFDLMTGSTPFGSVLGFSLLLGVGLLIIGRVFG